MEAFDVTYLGAALAGLLSFASPCVLPLVPAYLCFLGGATIEGLQQGKPGAGPLLAWPALFFVLGFSSIFIAMGATASSLNRLLFQHLDWLGPLAGGVIIVLGLHYMGAFRIALLNYEKRAHVESRPAGLAGSFVIGLAFAFGWTPCVGPVLASILLVAAGKETVGEGVALLAVYAAGMGVPFLAAALAARPFLAFLARFRHHLRKVELTLGALLVLTGALILFGRLNEVGQWLLETFPVFGRIG
jgi:cytochrome c-type biogenesis protein